MIDAEVSPAVRRAAQSICAEYVGGKVEVPHMESGGTA
jgi:hypothetical protein